MAEYENLTVVFSAETSDMTRELGKVEKASSKTYGELDKIAGFGAKAKQLGSTLTTHLTLPMAALGAGAITSAVDFENAMSQVEGALADPNADMQQLSNLAMELGSTTVFSAAEASKAMVELAKGGMTEADIKGGALAATMDLAAAGQMSLSDAANTTVQAMGTFGLKAGDAGRIANALAGAANASSADVGDLAYALSQGGLAASNAGMSIEETTAVLAAFADAGLNGSDAGTSLKTMLTRLQAPTDEAAKAMKNLGIQVFDANGNMLPIADIAEQLQTKLGGLTQAERNQALATIFGSDAMRAATVLMNEGAEGLGEYMVATKDVEAASRMANAQLGGTGRAIEEAKGAIETASIAVGTALAPSVESVAKAVQSAAEWFATLDTNTQTAILTAAGIAMAVGPAVSAIGNISTGFSKIGEAAGPALAGIASKAKSAAGANGVGALNAGLWGLFSAAVLAGIALVGTYIHDNIEDNTAAIEATHSLSDAVSGIGTGVDTATADLGKIDAVSYAGVTGRIEDLDAKINQTNKDHNALASQIATDAAAMSGKSAMLDGYIDTIVRLAGQCDGSQESVDELAGAVQGYNAITGQSISIIDSSTGALSASNAEIKSMAQSWKDAALAQLYAEEYAAAIKLVADEQENYAQAQQNLAVAQAAYDAAVKRQTEYEQAHGDILVDVDQNYANLANDVQFAAHALDDAQQAVDRASGAVADSTAAAAGLDEKVQEAQAAVDAAAQSMDEMAESTGEATEAEYDMAQAIAEAEEEWEKYREAIEEVLSDNPALIGAINSAFGSISNFETLMYDFGMSAEEFESRWNRLSDLNDPFKTIELNSEVSLQNLVDNMNANIAITGNWANNIAELYGRAGSQSVYNFINMIEGMGPEYAPLVHELTTKSQEELEAIAALYEQESSNAASSMTGNTRAAINALIRIYGEGSPEVQAAVEAMEAAAAAGMDGLPGDMAQDGSDAGQGLASGLDSKQSAVVDSSSLLGDKTIDAIIDLGPEMYARGEYAAGMLALGFGSRTADATTAAGTINAAFATAITSAAPGFSAAGSGLANKYTGGFSSQQWNASAAGSSIANATYWALAAVEGWTWNSGYNAGANFGNGLYASASYVASAAYSVASRVSSYLHHSTPDKGPLHGDDEWGYEMGEMFANRLASTAGLVKSAANRVASAAVIGGSVGVDNIATASDVSVPASGGGTVIVQNMTVRDDGDIELIAQRLHTLQNRRAVTAA